MRLQSEAISTSSVVWSPVNFNLEITMNLSRFVAASVVILVLQSCCFASDLYRITCSDGKNEVTYEVRFGGGKAFEQYTAYDPASKKFVYLTWKRDTPAPKPVGSIWNHKSGETIQLYKFPDVAQPLPIIPSIEDMKVCPKTGSKTFKKELVAFID